jgi:hypothetical protein
MRGNRLGTEEDPGNPLLEIPRSARDPDPSGKSRAERGIICLAVDHRM